MQTLNIQIQFDSEVMTTEDLCSLVEENILNVHADSVNHYVYSLRSADYSHNVSGGKSDSELSRSLHADD